MKPSLLLLTLGLSLLSAIAQDRATNSPPGTNSGSYYSWQNPDHPPLPVPREGLPVQRISQTNLAGTNNFLIDDREVAYPKPPADSTAEADHKRDLESARFPEIIQLREADAARMKLNAKTPEEKAAADYFAGRALKLKRLSRQTNLAPYTIQERVQLHLFAALGEIAKTNRESIRTGVRVDLGFNGNVMYYSGDPGLAERLAPLARKALASTNRADVVAFLEAKLTKGQQ